MHLIELPEAKVKRYIPSELAECDRQQYMDMCELIFRSQNEEINYDEFRTHAIYKLLKLKRTISKTVAEEEIKFANIAQISELIHDFFEEDHNGQRTIKQYYIHNPVPAFKPLWKTYHGPTDSFMNMTFGEYTEGLRMFHDFHASGDISILTQLTALFYRPKKAFLFIKKMGNDYDGDIRVPYNANKMNKRIKALKYAPIGFVYGFYLLFASFQKTLVEMKLNWGGQELDLSILFEVSKEEKEHPTALAGIGMDSIAFTMAESGAFGSIKELRNTNFWEIIVRMYDLRRADLERQKQEANAINK
jgi:hypothetical protein